ncbi:Oxysterol-binding protein 1 [Danaus plexippus plexippus]|uniref:Oxysterol-binding protein 1 n=1 Tax=Danaus plexippus plexippus TaxID=278856 RepID=A0A212FJ49_DANPL|nr:Oxysterol-binding protein 1 [Danaus plexippus plexippus]
MEEGLWDEANAEKLRLEEKQRAVRRQLEAEAEEAAAGGVGPRPRARLVHAPASPRPAATAASLQRSLLGLQAAPGLVRLPRHLLVLYIVTRPYG